ALRRANAGVSLRPGGAAPRWAQGALRARPPRPGEPPRDGAEARGPAARRRGAGPTLAAPHRATPAPTDPVRDRRVAPSAPHLPAARGLPRPLLQRPQR